MSLNTKLGSLPPITTSSSSQTTHLLVDPDEKLVNLNYNSLANQDVCNNSARKAASLNAAQSFGDSTNSRLSGSVDSTNQVNLSNPSHVNDNSTRVISDYIFQFHVNNVNMLCRNVYDLGKN